MIDFVPVDKVRCSVTTFVHRVGHLLCDWCLPVHQFMDPSASPPSPTPSEPDPIYPIRKSIWHSKDVADVEAKIFKLCKDDFGIPKNYYSAPLRDSNGAPLSNARFLPPPGAQLEEFHWDIIGESGPPPLPDYRELWIHVTKSGADKLSYARTPLELCMAVAHSMLGTRQFTLNSSLLSKRMSTGWLSMLHKGFLHRDIGIAAVFRLIDPIEMTQFVPGSFSQVLGQPEAGKDDQILQDQVERLRKAIADLEITGSCCGVVHPSDMTVKMKDYYASGENAHQPVSGFHQLPT